MMISISSGSPSIFEALWIDGRDIGDVDVVADIADESGLDGDEIRTTVADEQLRDRLRDHFAEAQQAGVTGVPAFVYDSYGAGLRFRQNS